MVAASVCCIMVLTVEEEEFSYNLLDVSADGYSWGSTSDFRYEKMISC